MRRVHEFPDRRAVSDEAADWLVKLDRDEPPTREELEELEEWLQRGPVHRQALVDLAGFWGVNVLTELETPLNQRPSTRVGSAWGKSTLLATAAGLVVAVALSLLIKWQPVVEDNGIYMTAVGQQSTIQLSEGSSLQLNTNTQVQVNYTEHYRNVYLLQGEAHFQVASNPDRPFRVYAGSGRVEAIGTAFTVHLGDALLDVFVSEGAVAVASLLSRPTPVVQTDEAVQDAVVVAVGQSIKLDLTEAVEPSLQSRGIVEILEPAEIIRRESWRDGLLVFSGEPLEAVVAEVSRYTAVSIEIADPALRAIEIGGRFRVGALDDMFDALEANVGIEVTWLNYNHVRLTAIQ